MNKQVIKWIWFVAILALVGYLVAHRVVQQNQSSEDTNRMHVVVSFYPLAQIAQKVGGDAVEVVNLTPAGSEPHDFDPSPRDVASLQAAKVFIYNGAGLESWAPRVIPELQQKGVRVLEATQGLTLLGSAEQSEDHANFDPHVWLDPVLMQSEVKTVASVFADADKVHAALYMENANLYVQELATLDGEFRAGLAQCKRHDIVTSHAAFAYLAKQYELTMLPIAGLSPEEEPSPARLGEIARFVKEHDVTDIFFETLVSPKLAETIAKETGAQTIAFNPLEGLSDEEIAQGKDYIRVQRENLQALRTALDCL